MRRRDPLPDPDVVHGLRELEAALAGEPAADPELAELVAGVRAARPEPEAAFLAQLDARVHAGFPPESDRPRRRRRARLLLPAAGLAAAAAVAAVIVLPGSSEQRSPVARPETAVPAVQDAASGSSSTSSSTSTSTSSASPKALSASGVASAPALQSARSALGAAAAAPAPRKVQRAAELTLAPARADVQDVADGVVAATQAVGGYVAQSQVATGDGSASAAFTLRIPSARLDDALSRLSKLAHVRSLTQDATDITSAFTLAQQRLADARATRQALLRALARATTDREIASLRARLADNRSEIAARKGALEALRRRADLSTVAVTVQGAATRPHAAGGGRWTPRDALRDAGRILEVAGGVALVALAVLVPLALLAAVGAVGAAQLRRRRREAALD